jgi:hypothetical protein
MPGVIGLAIGIDPARIGILMAARVPAAGGHVDAAAEGQIIVDHHDFLVMRSGGRVMAVQPHMDLRILQPLDQTQQGAPMGQRFDGAHIPAQNMHLQTGRALHQPAQKRADLDRGAILHIAAQPDAGIEIPADQQDLLARLEHRGAGGLEVIIGVDNHRNLRRALDAPAIVVGAKQGAVLRHGRSHRRLGALCQASSEAVWKFGEAEFETLPARPPTGYLP